MILYNSSNNKLFLEKLAVIHSETQIMEKIFNKINSNNLNQSISLIHNNNNKVAIIIMEIIFKQDSQFQ